MTLFQTLTLTGVNEMHDFYHKMVQIQEPTFILIILMLMVSLAINAYTFMKWHQTIQDYHGHSVTIARLKEKIERLGRELDNYGTI